MFGFSIFPFINTPHSTNLPNFSNLGSLEDFSQISEWVSDEIA